MPKKIRSGKYLDENGTITFFRKGKIKRFFISNKDVTKELNFINAIRLFECEESEKRANISDDYYENLKRNKRKLIETLEFDNTDISPVRKTGKSNTTFILKNLKGITSCSTLTEFDQDRIT